MNLAQPTTPLSVDDYLEAELRSEIKHEYLGGEVYAMAGASDAHNFIAGNLFAHLHAHLRGGPCRDFMSDMKVRLRQVSVPPARTPEPPPRGGQVVLGAARRTT